MISAAENAVTPTYTKCCTSVIQDCKRIKVSPVTSNEIRQVSFKFPFTLLSCKNIGLIQTGLSHITARFLAQ